MIYFLVNNDYQLLDARRHADDLRVESLGASLIEVPHTLREPDRERGFASVTRFASPLTSHRWGAAWRRYFASAREVEAGLKPRSDDVLFVYTEFELLNHFVVRRFKRANARVYLIEDGGVGTYLPFSLPSDAPLSLREMAIAAMTRCLPGLTTTQFHKVNGVVFPWVDDRQLDGICLYRPLSIVRSLNVLVLPSVPRNPVARRSGRVVFLNERMYDHYQTDDEYLMGLQNLVAALAAGFDEVLFKFHPREDAQWRARIRALLAASHPALTFIESERPFESLLRDCQPEVVASYFTTTLLNLDGTGVEPMFLYTLIPKLARQPLFAQLTRLLTQWRYAFVEEVDAVRSGYRSGLHDLHHDARATLAEIVRSGGSGRPAAGCDRTTAGAG